MSAPWDHISNINLELVIVQTDCIYLNYKCHYGSWTIMRIMTTNMIGQLQHLLDLLTFSYWSFQHITKIHICLKQPIDCSKTFFFTTMHSLKKEGKKKEKEFVQREVVKRERCETRKCVKITILSAITRTSTNHEIKQCCPWMPSKILFKKHHTPKAIA